MYCGEPEDAGAACTDGEGHKGLLPRALVVYGTKAVPTPLGVTRAHWHFNHGCAVFSEGGLLIHFVLCREYPFGVLQTSSTCPLLCT